MSGCRLIEISGSSGKVLSLVINSELYKFYIMIFTYFPRMLGCSLYVSSSLK